MRTHVSSSVPDHVRSVVGRAGSRLTPGGRSSAPVQRRTHLSATQDGAALTVEFTLRGTDRADAVYALADTDWVPCGDLEVASTVGDDTTYRARIDLAALAAATADHPVVAVAPTRPGSQAGDENPGGPAPAAVRRRRQPQRLRAPARAGRRLECRRRGRRRRRRGGRHPLPRPPRAVRDHRRAGVFETVGTDHGPVTPFVNTKGLLSVLVGSPMPPSSQVRNDGLSVARGVLDLRGALISRNTELSSASLIVQGRTSGYQAVVPATISFDAEATRRGFGLRSYSFTAAHDFGPDLAAGMITDDVADMFVEFVPADGSEPYKRRVGRSRFLVRARTRGGHVTHDDVTLSIEPYYTFKAKNPSLHLEIFDAAVHAHLRRQLSTTRAVTARRPAKPVWIVGELPYKAQDNGMHFFRHMREHHPEIDAYYVIREDSPERRNLEGLDHVLFYRSTEHIDKVLQAERIVGSHHPDFLYPSRSPRFRRRVRAEKVFLQHGVTGAKWMVPNYGKQVSSFETSLVCVCSEREKQFFVDDFGYAPKEVAVTGFARFDALFADDVPVVDRQILVMPTWRPWLQDPTTFTDSDYYHRWHDLLTGPEMRELEERTGAEVVLCLHPNMQQFSQHFSSEHVRVVVQGEVDVQHLIKESAVMVTDYSSVAFDFAFLRKPVVYYQFDAELFDAPHADPQLELPGAVVATAGRHRRGARGGGRRRLDDVRRVLEARPGLLPVPRPRQLRAHLRGGPHPRRQPRPGRDGQQQPGREVARRRGPPQQALDAHDAAPVQGLHEAADGCRPHRLRERPGPALQRQPAVRLRGAAAARRHPHQGVGLRPTAAGERRAHHRGQAPLVRLLLVPRAGQVLGQQPHLPALHHPAPQGAVRADLARHPAQADVPRPGGLVRSRPRLQGPGHRGRAPVERARLAQPVRHRVHAHARTTGRARSSRSATRATTSCSTGRRPPGPRACARCSASHPTSASCSTHRPSATTGPPRAVASSSRCRSTWPSSTAGSATTTCCSCAPTC